MREQPHYTNLLTEDFFIEHYNKKRMSYPQIVEFLKERGYNISVGTVYQYAKKLGIGRSCSEAKRNREENPLDYTISYMTESTIEAIDGFLLGDGHISIDNRSTMQTCRCTTGVEHQEFCEYLMKPFARYQPTTSSCESDSMKCGTMQYGYTKFHPDLFKQHQRWYPANIKQPPQDVRITPLSVMMWYLGDGSLVNDEAKNTVMLRLSTDGFSADNVEFLAAKLQEKGIACYRNGDNRVQVEAKGIPAFFNFIGHESPVKCYRYKFELPKWRFEAKRMREVADELEIDYNKLSYWVKSGKVPCLRASESGKPDSCQSILRQYGKSTMDNLLEIDELPQGPLTRYIRDLYCMEEAIDGGSSLSLDEFTKQWHTNYAATVEKRNLEHPVLYDHEVKLDQYNSISFFKRAGEDWICYQIDFSPYGGEMKIPLDDAIAIIKSHNISIPPFPNV